MKKSFKIINLTVCSLFLYQLIGSSREQEVYAETNNSENISSGVKVNDTGTVQSQAVNEKGVVSSGLQLNSITNYTGVIKITNRQGSALINRNTGSTVNTLSFKTGWKVFKKAVDNTGAVWYEVATDQFVKVADAYLVGTNMFTSSETMNDVAKVINASGAETVSGSGITKNKLNYGTSWKTFKKSIDVFGDIWYQVATDQYLRADDVQLNNFLFNQSSIGKTVVTVKNKNGVRMVDSKGNTDRLLPYKSSWSTSRIARDASGKIWYQVSTGWFIPASDVYLSNDAFFVSETSTAGTVTITNKNGSNIINSKNQVQRKVSHQSNWKIFSEKTDVFGDKWYKIGNDDYISVSDSALTNNNTIGDFKTIPVTTIRIKNTNGSLLMSSNGVLGNKLSYKSGWKTSKVGKDKNGVKWYQVATNLYLSEKDVYVPGMPMIVSQMPADMIGKVLKKSGTSLTDVNGILQRNLAYGSRWHISRKAIDVFGDTWYQVATNQYISGDDILVDGENMFVSSKTFSNTVIVAKRGGTKTVNNVGQEIKSLSNNSSWRVFQEATDKTGNIWYSVGTNEYVLASDTEILRYNIEKRIISGLPHNSTKGNYIIAHESGNPSDETNLNALENEVQYMTNNWTSAYVTHWVGGSGRIIQLAPVGEMSWGAGPTVNGKAFAQVELARTNNRTTFARDYAAYIWLLRLLAKEAGTSYVLDSSGSVGVKTHEWTSYAYGETDHGDPYSYLSKMGISRAQFANDIKNGL